MPTPASPPPSSPRRWSLWFLLLVAVLLGIAVFGENGTLRVYKSHLRKVELEAELRTLEGENTRLRGEIQALRSDPHAIEVIARKELGMVKEDELVYQFSAPKPER